MLAYDILYLNKIKINMEVDKMLTKKQKRELEVYYKLNYISYVDTEDRELRAQFRNVISVMETMLDILGYSRDDLVKLRNEAIKQHHFRIYCLFEDLNDILDEIKGQHVVFEYYNVPLAEWLIERYRYNNMYNKLKEQLNKIKKEMQKEKEIKKQK